MTVEKLRIVHIWHQKPSVIELSYKSFILGIKIDVGMNTMALHVRYLQIQNIKTSFLNVQDTFS